MRSRRLLSLLAVTCWLSSCSDAQEFHEDVESAKQRAGAVVRVADHVRVALDLLGLLPTYTCGEPRRTFVGRVVQDASVSLACATLNSTAAADGDEVALQFPAGCKALDRDLDGKAVFRYSGGEDRFALEADFNELSVDGRDLPAKAGYGTCADQTNYWGAVTGEFSGVTGQVELKVGKRDGLPVIGGSTLLVDGSGQLTEDDDRGTSSVTLTEVEYEVGEYMPKSGRVEIVTASGSVIRVKFDTLVFGIGKAEIRIDDEVPLVVAIPR